jgi:hypothetical protein
LLRAGCSSENYRAAQAKYKQSRRIFYIGDILY